MKYFTKDNGLYIVVPLLIFFILYIAVGTIYLKFNITEWTLSQRGFFVIIGLIASIMGEFIVFAYLDNRY